MPSKKAISTESPPALTFVGSRDLYVDGVPQSNLEVVEAPAYHHQVSPARALELLATGLYQAADKYEPPVVAEEEASNG